MSISPPRRPRKRSKRSSIDSTRHDVHSILVQLPLPDGINDEEVLFRIDLRRTSMACIRRTSADS